LLLFGTGAVHKTHNSHLVCLPGRAFPGRLSSVRHQVASRTEIVRSGLPDLVLLGY
jgi:hypothetical protein